MINKIKIEGQKIKQSPRIHPSPVSNLLPKQDKTNLSITIATLKKQQSQVLNQSSRLNNQKLTNSSNKFIKNQFKIFIWWKKTMNKNYWLLFKLIKRNNVKWDDICYKWIVLYKILILLINEIIKYH